MVQREREREGSIVIHIVLLYIQQKRVASRDKKYIGKENNIKFVKREFWINILNKEKEQI